LNISPFDEPFALTLMAPKMFSHWRPLRDVAIEYFPPFVGITLITVLMLPTIRQKRAGAQLLVLAAMGFTVAAIFANVFFLLSDQPTGYDFTGFWDGTDLYVTRLLSVGGTLGSGVFGVVASLLIWRVTAMGHEV
jgi:hypothetical protein